MNNNIKYIIEDYISFNPNILQDDEPRTILHKDIVNDMLLCPTSRDELRKIVEALLNKGVTDLNCIDVSHIEDFSSLFVDLDPEEIDISEWDVSNGKYFTEMFFYCRKFNCDLSKWRLDNAVNCYKMFSDCISLTSVPQLTNMNLGKPIKPTTYDKNGTVQHSAYNRGCYEQMFYFCESLQIAPELPATQLTPMCYYNMFAFSGLINAPKLSALKLAESCYNYMFRGCKSLKYINVQTLDPLSSRFSESWVDMAGKKGGEFVYNKNAEWQPVVANFCVPKNKNWKKVKE